ncbi:MAG TPA: hypothetical protein VIE65_13780 [Methylobacter sp.]
MVRKFRPKQPILETEVAASVVAWLEGNNWDVYQEVDAIDIVAVRGSLIWAIECKTTMGFDVLEQAIRRRSLVNSVFVATPPKDKSRVAKLACSVSGIGWIVVTRSYLNIECYPAFQRRITGNLRSQLRPEHKTFSKAGSPTGKRWTPFKETCRGFIAVIESCPGIELKEALKRFKHHYKSDSAAARSLSEYILSGVIKGIRMEQQGRSIQLYLIGGSVKE